ncbi:MAG TPA: tRNA lysidine(34) synthetase TilS [Candidatus Krumholzibacteria bacterium]|nr:tRNA lysidine(34) synthetase TilS [Candidatus Krumholzibacteria bacterium]HPD70904.1 tRNA lysidine(34) synthetase TilS [Candidatus Krumholzibacteria bacterium]HRY39396.1 tRNA lysidine(34) synthetase TilS [Candidatus Krumholzibacteria bacterium]
MTSSDLAGRVHARLADLTAEAARAFGEEPRAAGLLVALSGGPDSVALLALARDWAAAANRPLVAAHFNHRLRGDAADRDAEFCAALCRDLGVPLAGGGGDPRPLARLRGRGVEEAARWLRLAFLEDARAARGLAAIATGHHRDDQAETVVMRLFRGTGLDGLRGLRPRSGRRIRPLLDESRADLLAWLAGRGLAWREDPTNLDGSNVRGRVRRELLPLARDIFGDGAALGPARLAGLAETDSAFLDALAEAAWAQLGGPPLEGHAGASLDVAGTLALPEALARRVIRRWLRDALPVDLALAHVSGVLAWLRSGRSGSSLDLPGRLRLERVFARVGCAAAPPPLDDAARWRVSLEPLATIPDPPGPPRRDGGVWRLVSAADRLDGNLRVRHPRPGDRLQPFGLAGRKKLSDLMQERRIPAAWRPGVLVVEDRAGPLWVVGVAQAERTRLLPSTRQAVTIVLERRRADPCD